MRNILVLFCIGILLNDALTQGYNPQIDKKWDKVISHIEAENWKEANILIKSLERSLPDSSEYDEMKWRLRYMYIFSLAGLMNTNKLQKDEALNLTKIYLDSVLVVPGHPFTRQRCSIGYFQTVEDNPKALYVGTGNRDGTLIFTTETFYFDEDLETSFLDSIEGKFIDAMVKLKGIEFAGISFPRFLIEFQFLDCNIYNRKK
jgi:hypothetical protein